MGGSRKQKCRRPGEFHPGWTTSSGGTSGMDHSTPSACLPLISEKEFMAAVVQEARRFGWLVYHTHDSRRSEPGFPDLVLVHPGWGRIVFAELKVKARLTSHQEQWLRSIRQAGGLACLWRPEDLEAIYLYLVGRPIEPPGLIPL